jgi:hypothetical protein
MNATHPRGVHARRRPQLARSVCLLDCIGRLLCHGVGQARCRDVHLLELILARLLAIPTPTTAIDALK